MTSHQHDQTRVGLDVLGTDPHQALAELRSTAPVAWVDALGGWLVTGRDLAVAVMRDAETYTVDDPRFSTAQVVGPSMLSLDGAEHARHRAPFRAAFVLRELRDRGEGMVRDRARRLVEAMAPAGHGDLRHELAGPLAAEVVADLIGVPDDQIGRLRSWYATIVEGVTRISSGQPVGADAAAAFEELTAAVTAGIDAGDSLVAEAAFEITTAEAISNAAVIMFGGIETSEGMTATALWHLLTHRDQLDRLLADRSLVSTAVEESLRLEPAAARVDRYATRDVDLAGQRIRAGDLVIVSLTAANRDPQVFDDPDRFDLDRADVRRHLAFAHGPHTCVAAQLARMDTSAAVEAVLDLLPGVRLREAEAEPPSGLVFRKPATVPVTWDP